jgi:hypothetical protein
MVEVALRYTSISGGTAVGEMSAGNDFQLSHVFCADYAAITDLAAWDVESFQRASTSYRAIMSATFNGYHDIKSSGLYHFVYFKPGEEVGAT